MLSPFHATLTIQVVHLWIIMVWFPSFRLRKWILGNWLTALFFGRWPLVLKPIYFFYLHLRPFLTSSQKGYLCSLQYPHSKKPCHFKFWKSHNYKWREGGREEGSIRIVYSLSRLRWMNLISHNLFQQSQGRREVDTGERNDNVNRGRGWGKQRILLCRSLKESNYILWFTKRLLARVLFGSPTQLSVSQAHVVLPVSR